MNETSIKIQTKLYRNKVLLFDIHVLPQTDLNWNNRYHLFNENILNKKQLHPIPNNSFGPQSKLFFCGIYSAFLMTFKRISQRYAIFLYNFEIFRYYFLIALLPFFDDQFHHLHHNFRFNVQFN